MIPQVLLDDLKQFTAGLRNVALQIESLASASTSLAESTQAAPTTDQEVAAQIKIHKDFIWLFYYVAEATQSLSEDDKRDFRVNFDRIDDKFKDIVQDNDPAFQTDALKQEVREWQRRSYFHAIKTKDKYNQSIAGGLVGFCILAILSDIYYTDGSTETIGSSFGEENEMATTYDVVYWLFINSLTLTVNQLREEKIDQQFNRLSEYFKKMLGIKPSALDLNNPSVSSRYFFIATNLMTQLAFFPMLFAKNPNFINMAIITLAPQASYLLARVESSCAAPILNCFFRNNACAPNPSIEQTPLLQREPVSYARRLFNCFTFR
ncbi:MAG: hypothetical protein WC748_08750 [Legionellales bacterium]|jgi:hypothetical protein